MTFTEPAPLPQQPGRARPRIGRVVLATLGIILILILGAAGVWVLTHQQRVADQFTVWQFEPSTALASYADRSTMTDEGRFNFYASRPSIKATKAFDEKCASYVEDVGILGCYVHGERRIYLFDVTDDRLDGIEEVVAAHEMLHAVWDRMSDAEHDAVAPLLEAQAAARADDPTFVKTLEYYATAEPGERLNELHSIIGTEFVDVSPELEKYYSNYFSDRAVLVELHTTSNAIFTERQASIAQIVAQIGELKIGVDGDYASYNSGYDALNSDITNFNARADEGGQFTQQQFEAERVSLVSRQTELDALYTSIADRVTQYDGLVAQLDALNAEVADLNKSINIQRRTQGDSEQ
ncbi:hypothetical protein [Salinibacterium sp.]|uniref:hypothetical protein n=1 Tax=Salinibacterium sp. TaxID=1915057 RepID=UPI00286C52CF|nr:hypothetical protein [Salinibacterium sp.]